MREEVQKMGSKVAALQAHCNTLDGEANRWQQLWRQSAASNAQLTQRLAALQVCTLLHVLCLGCAAVLVDFKTSQDLSYIKP